MLTLRGKRRLGTKDYNGHYRHNERLFGTFYRRFVLPDTADAEHVSAKYTHGVLEVRIPKQPKALPRRIKVQVN